MRQLAISLLLLSACIEPKSTTSTQNANNIFGPGYLAVEGVAMVLTAPFSAPPGFFSNATLGMYDSAIITTGNVGATPGGTVGLPNDPNTPCYLSGCQFAVGAKDATFTEPFGILMAISGIAGPAAVPVFNATVSKTMITNAANAHTAVTQTAAFAVPESTLQQIAVAIGSTVTQMTNTGFLIGIVVESPSKIKPGGMPPFVQGATVTVANTAPVQLYFPDDAVTTYLPSGGVTNTSGMFFATNTNVGTASPITIELAIQGSNFTWAQQTVGIAPKSVTVGLFYAE